LKSLSTVTFCVPPNSAVSVTFEIIIWKFSWLRPIC